MKNNITVEQIDALLPQTQCGECDYAGCRPYAEAIVQNGESIDRCPPGGVKTLKALATLFDIDPQPFIPGAEKNARPPMLAVIDEAICIGCTKCIQACPVDAILGGAKLMHSVITDECTGCQLCVEPCPVDCIDMAVIEEPNHTVETARQRYEFRNKRLERDRLEKREKHEAKRLISRNADKSAEVLAKQDFIQAAIERAKAKKKIHVGAQHAAPAKPD